MLNDIKRTLWATADKLRANMDVAEYKHLVLGLIFIKYISDSFEAHKVGLVTRLCDPEDELFYGDADDTDIQAELEDRDYYTAANVFWVPESARWGALQAAAPQPNIGKRIDEALTLIEQENPRLKGILDKRFARAQLPDGKLGELVNLVATIGFGENPFAARDILGQVYEYSWACSQAPKASEADSSIHRRPSSRRWWRCWHPPVARCMTHAADRAACSCKAKSSSRPTAASGATCPSTVKRPTPPPGAWRP